MAVVQEELRYDPQGRMLYHPEFHHNHGKPYTESDLEYLCKYWGFDNCKSISLAIGRPEHSVSTKVTTLRRDGQFDYYKNLNKYW